jgi:hypothetical protein
MPARTQFISTELSAPAKVRLALLSFATLALAIAAAPTLLAQTISSAPNDDTRQRAPSRDLAQRLVLSVRAKRTVSFAEPITSVIVIDQGTITAELKNATLVTFTGLREGETIVIVSGKTLRRTLVVEVRPRPSETPEEILARAARRQRALLAPSGSYSFSFSPAFGGGEALIRQTFDYRRRLSQGRTLRVAADTFKFVGGERGATAYPVAISFGLNRLTLGLDTSSFGLDVLDSELSLTPLTLNGYTMRGIHLTSTSDSRLRGLEFFAGMARPSLTLFDNSAGHLGGAVLPIARGSSWQIRAGLIVTSARRSVTRHPGGPSWHVDGRYAPDERTNVEGEADFAHGAFSWRVRFDLRRRSFSLFAESLRLDRRSPFVSIGAHSGGRKADTFSVGWQPSARLSALFSYVRASSVLLTGSQDAALSNSNLFGSINYNLTRRSWLGFRFSQQEIETTGAGLSTPLRLAARSATLTHSMQLRGRWSNEFEASLTSSNEAMSGAQIERGLDVREELRHSWEHWSATAYLDYSSHTPSLASLIVNNPSVLPPALRSVYEADPSRFLILNRDLLPSLLGGIELPETRGLHAGLRFQGTFQRYNLTGDVRYSGGEILAREQRNILTTFGVSVRLDEANSVQVSGARAMGLSAGGGQSALTISYVHRFGAAAGNGFQFSKLLKLDRGHIQGRVFLDLDGDGQDDADEPGVAGMKVQLDGDQSVTTDERGRFRFSSINSGEYNVALISDALGLSLRASTSSEEHVSLSARQTLNVSFGVTNYGSVAGRVFNDLSLDGGQSSAVDAPGIAGVRLILCPTATRGEPVSQTVDGGGAYEFLNVAPGDYRLELDLATLPADFRVPAQTAWPVRVESLKNSYMDLPLSAQRAISGVIFIDRDGDGQFNETKDDPVDGVRVLAGRSETLTSRQGLYFLRNLPAGKIEVRIYSKSGDRLGTRMIELTAAPNILTAIDVAVRREVTNE